MAEKEPVIVIKKIYKSAEGHHGGSWKVAFADFMTAMMAFFLVMWLISQSEEVKQNVADYFSTPSIVEYNFSNYGVELTLEKMFLDLINEPLKFFQAFVTPVDFTPNLMVMGSKKVVLHHLADQLGDVANNVQVNRDVISFEIPAKVLFLSGTGVPTAKFVSTMEKVKGLTMGLEDSDVFVESKLFYQSVKDHSAATARKVAEQRLDLVSQKIEVHLEHETVDVYGRTNVTRHVGAKTSKFQPEGVVKFKITHKKSLDGERKPREFADGFGSSDESMSVYDSFVKQLTDNKAAKAKNQAKDKGKINSKKQ